MNIIDCSTQTSSGCPPHSHPHWEIICRISGDSTSTIGDQTYSVSSGDLVIIPPEVKHFDVADQVYHDIDIQLDFLEEDKRITQYSLLSMLSGLYGFLVSIIGGKIIDFLQTRQWSIGGHTLFAQQFTNALGFVFIIITILYLKLRIQPVSDAAAKKKK